MSPSINIGGNAVNGITIDGETVQEVTIDGQVAWTADPLITYEFDNMSPWTTYHGGQNNSRSFSGNNSYYCGNNDSGPVLAEATPYSSGKKIDFFSYAYWETSSSHGHGVRLLNSNGNEEGITATDNPEFDGNFGNHNGQISGGGSYNEWVTVTWNFDWSNNNVTVSRNGSDPASNTYSLNNGTDISTVQLVNYNQGSLEKSNLDSHWDKLVIGNYLYKSDFDSDEVRNSSKWNYNNSFDHESGGPSYNGRKGAGSRNDGSINATLNPFDGQKEITTFEFKWWEKSNQTGHVVKLRDKNNNQILEHGNENPQWYLNSSGGGRTKINGTNGTNYGVVTHAVFDLDWSNNQYQYSIKKLDGSHSESGTQSFGASNNPVDNVHFTGNGYGSADYCIFWDVILK